MQVVLQHPFNVASVPLVPIHYVQGRFQAPTLNLHSVPGFELASKIGLVMEEVPLDIAGAAELLQSLRATNVKESGDFASLFVKDSVDTDASDPVQRYFPQLRRDEAPIIEISGDAQDPVSVSLSVGKVVAKAAPDDRDEAAEMLKRAGEFWKRAGGEGAEAVVRRNFGTVARNMAPVIKMMEGELAFSIGMESIDGTADKGAFADRYMLAPKIRMKKPMGEWDSSAFVEVGCEEVQLPLLNTV